MPCNFTVLGLMKKIFDSIHNNLVAQKSEAAYEEARRITLAGETWSSHDCSLVFNKKKAARSRNNLKRRRGIDQKLSVCSTKHFCNEKQLFQPRMIKNSEGQICSSGKEGSTRKILQIWGVVVICAKMQWGDNLCK